MSLYYLVESFAVIFVSKFIIFTGGEISLIPLSVTYLPYKVLPKARYALFQPIIEQIAYDPVNNHIYTIGKSNIYTLVSLSYLRYYIYNIGKSSVSIVYFGSIIVVSVMDSESYPCERSSNPGQGDHIRHALNINYFISDESSVKLVI